MEKKDFALLFYGATFYQFQNRLWSTWQCHTATDSGTQNVTDVCEQKQQEISEDVESINSHCSSSNAKSHFESARKNQQDVGNHLANRSRAQAPNRCIALRFE
ncbi:MAG: hypothetical protein ACI87E_001379 [Mariniblastus sp.]|jgi:hypothetical protein